MTNSSDAAGDVPFSRSAIPVRYSIMLAVLAVSVLVLDVVTKVIVVNTIERGENIRILGGMVYLTHIRNPGAAFSMATGLTWLLALIALVVVAFIIRMAPRLRSMPWAVCLGLVLGGALGNLGDRIFREPGVMQGHVVDFISVFGPNAQRFPAFNVADMAITCGGAVLVALALFGFDYDGTRHHGKKAAAAVGASAADVAVTDVSDMSGTDTRIIDTTDTGTGTDMSGTDTRITDTTDTGTGTDMSGTDTTGIEPDTKSHDE